MVIFLENNNGALRKCKVGFSWTMFFFGFFTPLFRGDVKWFFVDIILSFCTLGLGHIVLCFVYNGIYIRSLLERGYRPSDALSKKILRAKGLIV